MSRGLAHRLTRLEQQTRARDLPRWDAVHAAEERLQTAARAQLDALLNGQEPPASDASQAEADAALLERWCVVQGVPMDWQATREALEARLAVLAARYAADPPVRS